MEPSNGTGVAATIPVGVVEVDPDGRIAMASVEAERLFGYTWAELVGQPVGLLLSDDADLAGVRGVDSVSAALRSAVEHGCRRKDGTEFPARATISALDTQDGVLLSAAIQPAAERTGRGWDHDLLEMVVSCYHDALMVIDPDGEVLMANPAAQSLLGYGAELVGQHRSVMVGEHERAAADDMFARVLRGEHLTLHAVRRMGRDGTAVVTDMSVWPVRDAAGEVRAVAWTGRAINDEYQLMTTVRALVEALSIAVVAVDEEGRIRLVNPAIEEMFGYHREELVGEPIEMLVPVSLQGVHGAHRRRYSQHPRSRRMGEGQQLLARRKDGTTFPVDVALSAITTDTGLLVAAAVHDVSERVRAEERRARAERDLQISRRMESLGQLAGGVAHDFNNLLGVILGRASFLEEELGQLNEVQGSEVLAGALRDIEHIRNAAERAARQTQQLLAFGRREVNQPRRIDLNDAVTYMHRLLGSTLGPNIQLIAARGQALRPVLADPGEVEQILMNLAVNARDAMPDGGTLRLETANVDVDELYATGRGISPGRYVRMRVSDTGPGMEPEVAERAFEPFFTTRKLGDAKGLGLTTVYTIVSNAGGHVGIYSEQGHGTTVAVLLPAIVDGPEETAPGTAPKPLPADPSTRTILVVDDEAGIRDIARRVLTKAGYTVLLAEDGPHALALAAQQPAHSI
jgi:PAS domain S-box-containing protein